MTDNYNPRELYKKKNPKNPRQVVKFSVLTLAFQQMQGFNSL